MLLHTSTPLVTSSKPTINLRTSSETGNVVHSSLRAEKNIVKAQIKNIDTAAVFIDDVNDAEKLVSVLLKE